MHLKDRLYWNWSK